MLIYRAFICLALFFPILASSKELSSIQQNVINESNSLCECRRGYADLVESIMPSVVSVTVNSKVVKNNNQNKFEQLLPKEFRDFFGNMRPFDIPSGQQNKNVLSSGSGFIIDSSCHILTNYHIVQNADTINVKFYDNNSSKAKIVGYDKLTDIALLKVDCKGGCKNFAKIGKSENMKVGDKVLAIGNPYGFSWSVSSGIVSAIGRNINLGPYDDFIQVDLSLNFGNSGGPLINMKGEVIGINTAIISNSGGSIGLGFAIPTETINTILTPLKKSKQVKRGCIGVVIQDVTQSIAESIGLPEAQGALIAEVKKGSAADKAGIKIGDIVIEFDNKPIKSRSYFGRAVATYGINKFADIKVIRNKKTLNLKIKIAEMNENQYFPHFFNDQDSLNGSDGSDVFIDELNLRVATLDDEIKRSKNLDKDMEGVVITGVKSGSHSELVGIEVGDIINQCNQVAIKNVDELKNELEIAKRKGRSSVLLYVSKARGPGFVVIPLQ